MCKECCLPHLNHKCSHVVTWFLKISLECHLLCRIRWLILAFMLKRQVTCEDVLRRDLGLHFQRVLRGVRDLGAHMSHLANKDGRQELGLLHTDQSCNTAVLEGHKKTWRSQQWYQRSETSGVGASIGTLVHNHWHSGIKSAYPAHSWCRMKEDKLVTTQILCPTNKNVVQHELNH